MDGCPSVILYCSDSLRFFRLFAPTSGVYVFMSKMSPTYANRLSIVFEDIAAARSTLDAVRAFIRTHPTVYLSTHTPLGCENLNARKIVDLDNPPASVPVGDIAFGQTSGKYVCSVCGYVYDPAEHNGVAFDDLPDDWRCPRCKQGKDRFNRA